jgi:hypothetical protein
VPPSAGSNFTDGIVRYKLFEGAWPWVPDFAAMQPLRQGRVSGLNLAVRPHDENFGIAFSGFIAAPADGDYTFKMQDDSGATFRIHDATVIDDDFPHTGKPVSGTIRLAAGRHAFRLYYRHQTGPMNLSLSYWGPGISEQGIPARAFSIENVPASQP